MVACEFVAEDHTAQLCLRIVQWLEGLASKALDLEAKVVFCYFCMEFCFFFSLIIFLIFIFNLIGHTNIEKKFTLSSNHEFS